MMGVIPSKRGDCQNGRFCPQTAKMAALANLVPNDLPIWHQQISCQKNLFFFSFFFVALSIIYDRIRETKGNDDEESKG